MIKAKNIKLCRVLVGKGPANIIMAAHVVDLSAVRFDGLPPRDRLVNQCDLARRKRLPAKRHKQRIVGYRAFLWVDVRNDLVGVHDGFGLEQQRRRRDAAHAVERPQQ